MRPQFHTRSLFIFMVVIAVVVSVLVRILPRQPIIWNNYTSTSLQKAFHNKKSVLISLSANWSISGMVHERDVICSTMATQIIRDSGLLTLRADLTNLDPAAVQLMKDTGLIKIPAYILYNPDFPGDPIILEGFVSEEELLDAIHYNSVRTPTYRMDSKGSIGRD